MESPGTYVVILRSTRHRAVQVGRLGVLQVEPGYYAYVGSALGAGGVAARLRRHFRGSGRVRWHIDYLRAHTRPIAAWYCCDPARMEHRWVQALSASPGARSAMTGFGASDCDCESHLFFFSRPPSRATFQSTLRRRGHLEGRLSCWSGGVAPVSGR